jgi:hypothetical protein
MTCKFLDPELSRIVRCSFTSEKVCREWAENTNLMRSDLYSFCESCSKQFKPTSMIEEE